VSDHGMLEKDNTKVIKPSMIFDDEIVNLIKDRVITVARNDTQIYIYFTKSKSNEQERSIIIEKMTSNKNNNNLYRLYAKGKFPKHWQFDKDIELVPDLILEALPPATFVKENHDSKLLNIGTHGYDATNQKNLMGIFIALGPGIVKGKEIKTFENIHIFPFMSELLAIKTPEVIDGKREVLTQYLKNKLDNK